MKKECKFCKNFFELELLPAEKPANKICDECREIVYDIIDGRELAEDD